MDDTTDDSKPTINLNLEELDATVQMRIGWAKVFLKRHEYICISNRNWQKLLQRRVFVFVAGMAVSWLIGALCGFMVYYITNCPM